jgi:hypothetical protein
MSDSSFEVERFSRSNLYSRLRNPLISEHEIASHDLANYLYNYLHKIGVKSILVEDPYTDRDYLDDYCAYYARCFATFDRRCKRLHFFRLSPAPVRRALTSNKANSVARLQEHYKGFVVVRPLPKAIVGRTVLEPYPLEDRRHFPATMKAYKANVCGIELQVESLAFQEQDAVLAACATVALWSCFHKTAHLFNTSIPTPAAITRVASQAAHYGRRFPSSGLTIEEICSAIRHNGLEPEVVDLRSEVHVPLPTLLYSYLKMGLPVILVVKIVGEGLGEDLHAITLVGFSLVSTPNRAEEVPGSGSLPLIGKRIDKFYGHDDQIGPFSRIKLKDAPCEEYPLRLVTSWKDPESQEPYPVYPTAVVVPVYNKIRLTFLDVVPWVKTLDVALSYLLPEDVEHEWDIHLLLSNEYKETIRQDDGLDARIRDNILLAHHPRFWWRAVLKTEDSDLLELLFDATGIAPSFPVSYAIWRSESFALVVLSNMEGVKNASALADALSERFLKFLQQSIQIRVKPFQ